MRDLINLQFSLSLFDERRLGECRLSEMNIGADESRGDDGIKVILLFLVSAVRTNFLFI